MAGPTNSSGRPHRPNAVRSENTFFSASDRIDIGMSVRNGPGARQFTVTPHGPRSRADARHRPTSAAFVAEYAFRFSFDTRPMMLEMWTTRPHCRAFIPGTTARV